MEEARALTIVTALASGVNPLTGELFAVDSPYQSPDVIRALYSAVRRSRRRAGGGRAGRPPTSATPANRGAMTKTVSCCRLRRRTAARGAGADARSHARRDSGTADPARAADSGGRSADRRSGKWRPGGASVRAREIIPEERSSEQLERGTIQLRVNPPRSYVQRPLSTDRPERCTCAAHGARQHHRQVEWRRAGARHRPAGERAARAGHHVDVTIIDPRRRSVAARRSRSSQRVHGLHGRTQTPERAPRARTLT